VHFNHRGKNRAAYHHSKKKKNKQTANTLKWKWCWTGEKFTCSLALLGICRVLISMSISCDGGGGRFLKQWTVLVSPNKICNDRPPMITNISFYFPTNSCISLISLSQGYQKLKHLITTESSEMGGLLRM